VKRFFALPLADVGRCGDDCDDDCNEPLIAPV
jgi:hypothetical protein